MSIPAEIIKGLPVHPGCYVFKKGNTPVYVGKAVNIKNRVRSYFRSHVSDKVTRLRIEATMLEWIPAETEIEALIKEAELIKRYYPKYNVLIHDYFYVGVTKENFPKVFVTRRPLFDADNYIGPFTSGLMLRAALKTLRRIFPYCTCFKPHKRMCLNAEMGRCLGYCCIIEKNPSLPPFGKGRLGGFSSPYAKNITAIKAILTGKRKPLVAKLDRELKRAAAGQDFERAAALRDQLRGIENVFRHRPFLRERALARRIPSKKLWKGIEKTIQDITGLQGPIRRVEGYDISNISGVSATGSMVVFTDGHADKKNYRMFKIKSVRGSNDVAMHKEVMRRRLGHTEWPLPDCFVIDGGKPQLGAVLEVMDGLRPELSGRVVALAKREEELYRRGLSAPIRLDSLPSGVNFFFQRIRDESHRFAKKYHHKVREVAFRKDAF